MTTNDTPKSIDTQFVLTCYINIISTELPDHEKTQAIDQFKPPEQVKYTAI
jgi:hypothetical protein